MWTMQSPMNREDSGGVRRVVAITGASGFVGRRLVQRHLAKGDSVRILTRAPASDIALPKGVTACRGDLTGERGDLEKFVAGADVLYHCAAELHDSDRMHFVNVFGTGNLAEAAANRIRHWVQLSSVAIYGRQPAGRVSESTPPDERNTYPTSLTKLAAEKVVREYAGKGGFSFSILRPCKIYGADMSDASLRSLAAYVRRGLFFFIGQPGVSANYVHVDNVIEALLLCATHDAARNRAFNLCDGFTMEEMVAAIADKLGCAMPRMRIPEWAARAIARLGGGLTGSFPLNEERIAGLTNRTQYATDAIKQLGYRSVASLERGIGDLLDAEKQVATP